MSGRPADGVLHVAQWHWPPEHLFWACCLPAAVPGADGGRQGQAAHHVGLAFCLGGHSEAGNRGIAGCGTSRKETSAPLSQRKAETCFREVAREGLSVWLTSKPGPVGKKERGSLRRARLRRGEGGRGWGQTSPGAGGSLTRRGCMVSVLWVTVTGVERPTPG